jgi:hypothetical protein
MDARPAKVRRRRTTVGSLVVSAAAIALLGSACAEESGEPVGVATNPSKTAQAAPPPGGEFSPEKMKEFALGYSRCMRQNGVPKFPDPQANGGIAIDGRVVDQNSPQFKKAHEACKGLLPAAPPGGVPENREQALKYSKCMRENGVPKFPDPNAGGGLGIDSEKLGVDPNGPVFKKADKLCQKHLGGAPNIQQGGPGPQGG